MIRGVIFDCDGTLLDTMPLWREAAARYLSRLGIEVDKAPEAKLFEMAVPESVRVTRDEFNPDSTVEEITTGIHETVAWGYHDKVRLKPRAGESIKALTRHRVPLAVVSSDPEVLVRSALARLGLEQNSMKILVSGEIGLHKRQPDAFLTAVWLMGVKPEDIWVLKDVLHAIRITKTVGSHPVVIRDEASLVKREALEAEAEAYREEYLAEIPAAWLRRLAALGCTCLFWAF